MSKNKKFGAAALIGLPNSGKSTLVNALVGSKVSIVSRKAQTTRCRVTGIMLEGEAQIVLVDAPGVFDPKSGKRMDRAMVHAAWQAIDDVECILHVVDMRMENAVKRNKIILEKLPKNVPVFLVLNKVDKMPREAIIKAAQAFNDAHDYDATFMISALKKDGLEALKEEMVARMPAGEWGYDEDDLTTMPMRFLAAEITRETIFDQLHEELPYAALVETEKWEEFDNGSVRIQQVVTVERDTQKAIVLGRGGSQIKKIGEVARKEMQEVLGFPVHLKIFVKTDADWADKVDSLTVSGLHDV